MQTFWWDPHHTLFVLALPWSLSCQRSCTPSLRTSWTGTSPRGNARRRRKRRGTVSTRRSLTKRWRPQRSPCSPLKLSYCQRRYWKYDLHKKLGHLCLLFVCLSSSESNNIFAPFLFFCSFVFYFNFLSVALLEYCPAVIFFSLLFSILHKCNEDFLWMFLVLLWFTKKEVGFTFLPQASSRCSFFFFVLLLTRLGNCFLWIPEYPYFLRILKGDPLTFILGPPSCNHHSCTQK